MNAHPNADPRVVGGIYRDTTFGGGTYEVLAIEFTSAGWLQYVTVRDTATGRARTHGTSWDIGGNALIS